MSLLMDTETGKLWARVDFLIGGEMVVRIPEEFGPLTKVVILRDNGATSYYKKSADELQSDRPWK